MSDPRVMPTQSELLEGAWSPDVLVKLECLRHGQHSAISRIDMKCQLCHDANRPGVIERRYVDEAERDHYRAAITTALRLLLEGEAESAEVTLSHALTGEAKSA